MSDTTLTEDTLFLACTRPAMWQGVPLEGLVYVACGTMVTFVLVKNPLYLGIGVVLFYVMKAFVSRDYNMFGVLRLWSETKARSRNNARWGGSSISPLPLRRARKPHEVSVNV